jgi:hypothetical protein
VSGLEAREQHIVGPLGAYMFRTVLAGMRLFSISVKGTDDQVQDAESIVYLDSFAVTQ